MWQTSDGGFQTRMYRGFDAGVNRQRTLEAIYGEQSLYYSRPVAKAIDLRLKSVKIERWFKWCGMNPRNGGKYQKFLVLFNTIMMLRWFLMLLIFLRRWDEKYAWMLGDFTKSTQSYVGRFYFLFNLLSASVPSTVWTWFCLRSRNDARYSQWLQVFEMTAGKVHWDTLRLTRYAAMDFWRFSRKRVMTYKLFRLTAMILSAAACVLLEMENLARLSPPALIWTPMQILWCSYTIDILILPVVTFRCVCYYFHLRIDKLRRDAKIILNHLNAHRSQDVSSEMVFDFVEESIRISTDMTRYTKYWRFFFLVNYGHLYCAIVGSAILAGWNRGSLGMPVASSTVAGIIYLFYIFLFFYSWVTTANIFSGGYDLFLLSNQMAVHKIHNTVVSKLSNAVASMAARPIGFDCYSFFIVKWAFLYDVLMFTGSTYFVLLDNLLF